MIPLEVGRCITCNKWFVFMRLERPDFCTYMKARSFIPKAPKLRDFCTSFAMREQHFHV